MKPPRAAVTLALALALAAGLFGLASAAAPPVRPAAPRAAPITPLGLFRFTRLNHAYSEPATAIDPIAEGPLTIRLASPRNKMVLVSNTLRLEPGVDGSHTADLEVSFFGKAWVVADVAVSGVAQHFEEEVVVPRQTKRLEGRVRVARTAGGYLLTPERLPRELPVALQSHLGNDIVDLCERFAALPFSDLDCSGLARALSTAAVPLPAGEPFYLATADLTPEERRQLEGYLAGTRPAVSPANRRVIGANLAVVSFGAGGFPPPWAGGGWIRGEVRRGASPARGSVDFAATPSWPPPSPTLPLPRGRDPRPALSKVKLAPMGRRVHP